MSWDEWYRLARAYRDAHGDLLVPKDYVCPGGQKLGRWIERQRAKYNGVESVPGHLDRTQVALLNRLGMVWKLEHRHAWGDWLEQLDWYREKYGNLEVPYDFARGDYHLGNWVKMQRKSYASGQLTEGEIADLEARGMTWSLRTRPRAWEDWYADAAAYYAAHGDLMVPPDYRTDEGRLLGVWIYRQRDVYMGRKAGLRLTPGQAERLEAIGMVWNPQQAQAEAWERMYQWVSQYRAETGKLPVWPRTLRAPDGRSMLGWINTQRAQLAAGKVSPSRREKLAQLGITAQEKAAAEN